MKNSPEKHHRRSIRLKDYDYSRGGGYFLTLCTQNRQCIMGEVVNGKVVLNEIGVMAESIWSDLPKHYPNIELDAFVVMPNHFHAVIKIHEVVGAIHELPLPGDNKNTKTQRRRMLIPRIMGYFKMNSAKRINNMRGALGPPVWQRNYYEHIIRNEHELNDIREYIAQNPLKWELDGENPRNNLSVKTFSMLA